MNKQLTIHIDEKVFDALYSTVDPQRVDKFVEDILRSHVTHRDLDSAYQEMAQDIQRESEALDWSDATCKDVEDEEG